MPRNCPIPIPDQREIKPRDLNCRIIRCVSDKDSPYEAVLELPVLAQAIKTGVQEAMVDQDSLIDYPELARRMHLREKFVRRLKNAGIIHAALDLGKVVRFHWPSVLAKLKGAEVRNGRWR